MAKRKAMTSEHASKVKRAGHAREEVFADLIGGEVNKGAQTDKKDVLDKQHRFHSVKGGTWWQIFLYGRERFVSNTILKGIGRFSKIMIDCIDAFPKSRAEYRANPHNYKIRLQKPMAMLAKELDDIDKRRAFFMKALFNGGEVNYLTVQPYGTDEFYVFNNDEVVDCLVNYMQIDNSKAQHAKQYDRQKVLFKIDNRNAGEIEIRTDSVRHYRQVKCRVNSRKIYKLLRSRIDGCARKTDRVYACGSAVKSFHL